MNKKLVILLIAVAVIFLGSGIWVLAGMQKPAGDVVEIVQNGEVLYTIDLGREKSRSIRIETENGSYNVVTIEDGEIYVSDAGCADHTCMKMGHLRSENLPIVCLPNKLVIRYADEEVTH